MKILQRFKKVIRSPYLVGDLIGISSSITTYNVVKKSGNTMLAATAAAVTGEATMVLTRELIDRAWKSDDESSSKETYVVDTKPIKDDNEVEDPLEKLEELETEVTELSPEEEAQAEQLADRFVNVLEEGNKEAIVEVLKEIQSFAEDEPENSSEESQINEEETGSEDSQTDEEESEPKE